MIRIGTRFPSKEETTPVLLHQNGPSGIIEPIAGKGVFYEDMMLLLLTAWMVNAETVIVDFNRESTLEIDKIHFR